MNGIKMFSLGWLEPFSSYFPGFMALAFVCLFVLLEANVKSPKLLNYLQIKQMFHF